MTTKKQIPEVIMQSNDEILPIIELCEEYIQFCFGDEFHEDTDFPHYIFEKTMTVLYGDDIFEKINAVTP